MIESVEVGVLDCSGFSLVKDSGLLELRTQDSN